MTKKSFSSRKKARRLALQALYGWQLSNNSLVDIEQHILSDHEAETFDVDYFHVLLFEVPDKLAEIESAMQADISRKIEAMGPIELSILRIAVYELLFRLEIPYRVVINEALELAKTFGAKESYKFVNGVLDKVARKLRPEVS